MYALKIFTKAFDYVDYGALFYKLRQRDISGNYLNVLRNMFGTSKNKVKWQGFLSESMNCSHGVLQSGIISPKLFNECLSDIRDHITDEIGIILDELLSCLS